MTFFSLTKTRTQHHWRAYQGQCECEQCVSGFVADFLAGKAGVYDFKAGNFTISRWSVTNRRSWQQDQQRYVCGECGYPLDWRHSPLCHQFKAVEQAQAFELI